MVGKPERVKMPLNQLKSLLHTLHISIAAHPCKWAAGQRPAKLNTSHRIPLLIRYKSDTTNRIGTYFTIHLYIIDFDVWHVRSTSLSRSRTPRVRVSNSGHLTIIAYLLQPHRSRQNFSLQYGDAPADNQSSGMLRRERKSSWIFADESPWLPEPVVGLGMLLLCAWPRREPISRSDMDTRNRQRRYSQHISARWGGALFRCAGTCASRPRCWRW